MKKRQLSDIIYVHYMQLGCAKGIAEFMIEKRQDLVHVARSFNYNLLKREKGEQIITK